MVKKRVTMEDMEYIKLYFYSFTDEYPMLDIGDINHLLIDYESYTNAESQVKNADFSRDYKGAYRFMFQSSWIELLISFRQSTFTDDMRDEFYAFIDQVKVLGITNNIIASRSVADYTTFLKVTFSYSD